MRPGVWTDRGLYLLNDYDYRLVDERRVFKFRLEQANFDSSAPHESARTDLRVTRQMPSRIKQLVYNGTWDDASYVAQQTNSTSTTTCLR